MIEHKQWNLRAKVSIHHHLPDDFFNLSLAHNKGR